MTESCMSVRLLVTGGRDYADREVAFRVLDNFDANRSVGLLINGGATGADALAREWAVLRNVPCITVPADWKQHGRAAGPIRNQEMIDSHQPDHVIAFSGGKGTRDMIRRARTAGAQVHIIP